MASFLREADARVEEFLNRRKNVASGFVPSDFVAVYHALGAIMTGQFAGGNVFCEWGSGFGVVASLAAMLDFDARGIEIDRDLCDAAQQLAEDFDLLVGFIHGSFIPPGGEELADKAFANHVGESFRLVAEVDDAYEEMGLDMEDFHVVFAYPWPDERPLIECLFDTYAAEGALLLTYHEFDSLVLKRKMIQS